MQSFFLFYAAKLNKIHEDLPFRFIERLHAFAYHYL